MSDDSRSRSRSPFNEDDENDDSPKRGHDRRNRNERSRSSSKRGLSENRVYVSNIPFEFKWQDLKDLFRSEVGNVAYVEMFTDDGGRPRGSAVVEFESFDMAQKAIDVMHRFEVKGRQLIVKEKKDAVHSKEFKSHFNKSNNDRGMRPSRDMNRRQGPDRTMNSVDYGNTYGLSVQFLESHGIRGPLVNKVFVTNLDYKVSEDDLKEVFKVAGKVTDVELMKNDEGKSRGFAIIEYEHPIQAVQAITMLNDQSYYDRRLNVRMDRVADKHKKDGSMSKLPPGLKGLGMGLGARGEAVTEVQSVANPSAVSSPMANIGSGGIGFDMAANNFNSNMRPNINPAMALMGMAGINQLNSALTGGIGGMGMGFNNMASAMNNPTPGINLPSANMMGVNNLGLASNLTGNGFNQPIGSSSSSGFSGDAIKNFNSSSNERNFGNSRNMVKIKNLPNDYTWQSLKDLCRNYGDIKYAEIPMKGTGLVRFSSEAEARRTADMLDQQRFDGKMLEAQIV